MVIFFPVFNKNGRKLFVHVTIQRATSLDKHYNYLRIQTPSHFTNSFSSSNLNTEQKIITDPEI